MALAQRLFIGRFGRQLWRRRSLLSTTAQFQTLTCSSLEPNDNGRSYTRCPSTPLWSRHYATHISSDGRPTIGQPLRSSEDLEKAIVAFSKYKLTVLTIKQLMDVGKIDIVLGLIAHIISEISCLPGRLLKSKDVEQVKQWYVTSFRELMEFEPVARAPVDMREKRLRDFNGVLERILKRHVSVVLRIAVGIMEIKQQYGENYMRSQIKYFLDRIYMSRIGIRLLAHQHIACTQKHLGDRVDEPDGTMVGLIDEHCHVKDVIEDAYLAAQFVCQHEYGICPSYELMEPTAHASRESFPYIPSHLYHILFELLKNSMRAVVEWHQDKDDDEPLPPIRVILVRGKSDITIKISDAGGGIPRADMPYVTSYVYTTARARIEDIDSLRDNTEAAPMAGLGYGIPLSRLYAVYLGGDVTIVSLEGYGTDAYVHLKVAAEDAEEVLPHFNAEIIKHYELKTRHDDWLTGVA